MKGDLSLYFKGPCKCGFKTKDVTWHLIKALSNHVQLSIKCFVHHVHSLVFLSLTLHLLLSLINGVQHDWRFNLVRSNIGVIFAREYESRTGTEWLMDTYDLSWVVISHSFLVLWPVYETRLMFSCKELMYKLLVKLSVIFHCAKLSLLSMILFGFLGLM